MGRQGGLIQSVRSRPLLNLNKNSSVSPLIKIAYATKYFLVHFVYLFKKYLWGINHVPGTVVGARATSVNKTAQDPSCQGAEHQLEKTDNMKVNH